MSRRDYENDVYYEVWRSGKNPDAINFDRVEDHYWNGDTMEVATAEEIRRQTRNKEPECWEEEEWQD